MPFQARDIAIPPVPDWLQRGVDSITRYVPDILSRDPYVPTSMLTPEYMKDWLQGQVVDPSEMMYEGLTNQMGGGQPLAQVSAKGYEPLIEKLTDRWWSRFNPQFVTSPKSTEDIVPLVVRFPEKPLPYQLIPELLGRESGGFNTGVFMNLRKGGAWGSRGGEPALLSKGNVIFAGGRDPTVVRHEGTHYLIDLLALGRGRQPLSNVERAAKDFLKKGDIKIPEEYLRATGYYAPDVMAREEVERLLKDIPGQYPDLANKAWDAWGHKYMMAPFAPGDELLASFMERTPKWWGNPIAALKENPWLYGQKAYTGLADMLSSYRYIPKEAFGKLGLLPPALLGVSMMGGGED